MIGSKAWSTKNVETETSLPVQIDSVLKNVSSSKDRVFTVEAFCALIFKRWVSNNICELYLFEIGENLKR